MILGINLYIFIRKVTRPNSGAGLPYAQVGHQLDLAAGRQPAIGRAGIKLERL